MILTLSQQEINHENNSYWDDIRKHDYNASFRDIKDFIHQNSTKMRSPKRRKNGITWIVIVLLPLLIFLSCQRKSYIQPQGATLSFTANDSLFNKIDHILRQYSGKEWKAVFWPKGGIMRGTVSTSADQYNKLKEFSEKLKALPGITELYVSSLKTTIKEPILSRLSYKLFNWHFNAVDASDQDLRMAIESKLRESGQHELGLQLVNVNGRKQVNIVPNDKTRNFSIKFTLPDGSSITALAEKWE